MYRSVSTLIALSLLLGLFTVGLPNAMADSWADDFTNPNLQFDARWEMGGLGHAYPINGTYAEAVSFTTPETAGWHGPWIRTAIAASGDFNISLKLDCIADYAKETRGRLEVQLLDQSGGQFYSFGWEDVSLANQLAAFNLKGEGNNTIFSTGGSVKYSVFSGKQLSLARSSGAVKFFIQGSEGFETSSSSKALSYIQISFYKYELDCTPTYMRVDSISVAATPAATPNAPQALAVSPSDGEIALSWLPPASNGGLSIIGYKIYRSLMPGSPQYLTTVGHVNSYNDTGLSNGQDYYYSVSAVNDMGEGALSNEIEAMPFGLPGQPGNFQAVSGDDYVNLAWQPPSSDGGRPILGYSLYRDGALIPITIDSTTFNDTGLASGVQYQYRVSAYNSIGEGPLSVAVQATPGATLHLPMPPQNLRIREGNQRAYLSWDPPESNGNSYIVNYTIYRGASPGVLTVLKILGPEFEFDDANLVNGQIYYYSLSATNGVGEGPLSSEVSVTPMAPIAPSEPMQFTINGTQNSVRLEWAPPLSNGGAEIIGYKVYRGTSSGQLDIVAAIGIVYSFTDTGVSPDQNYYYSVSAQNDAGEGQLASELNITVRGEAPIILNPDDTATSIGINLNSTIITFLAFGIAIALFFIFLRVPSKESGKNSSKGPDKAVDDKSEDDGTNKEEEQE